MNCIIPYVLCYRFLTYLEMEYSEAGLIVIMMYLVNGDLCLKSLKVHVFRTIREDIIYFLIVTLLCNFEYIVKFELYPFVSGYCFCLATHSGFCPFGAWAYRLLVTISGP